MIEMGLGMMRDGIPFLSVSVSQSQVCSSVVHSRSAEYLLLMEVLRVTRMNCVQNKAKQLKNANIINLFCRRNKKKVQIHWHYDKLKLCKHTHYSFAADDCVDWQWRRLLYWFWIWWRLSCFTQTCTWGARAHVGCRATPCQAVHTQTPDGG